jgi:bifunctional DNase/RNase
MENRVKLSVMGISYSPMQNGAFALLLAVEGDSKVRIPVVIGGAEAQSIAIRLERVHTPRPLTHDLFCSFAHAFGVELKEVFIYKFEDGIYSSELTFTDGTRTIGIDARTSDAIAIAMRADAPIYTTQAIVDETGIELEEVEIDSDSLHPEETGSKFDVDDDDDDDDDPPTSELNVEQLETLLAKLIEDEEYEEAARISTIIQQKKNKP